MIRIQFDSQILGNIILNHKVVRLKSVGFEEMWLK